MIFENQNFKCKIDITENPMSLNINDYLDMGLRNNKKRNFLFISKKLGKHLAISPSDMDDLGRNLVSIYNDKLDNSNKSATLISFAETATSLGYSVFKHLDENVNEYIHTTRELDAELDEYIEFLEEHSHASNHKLYTSNLKNIESNDTIILVDDEITTAKTCVNIIRQLQDIYPNKNYVIFSILNWISDERESEIYKEVEALGCKVSFVYLFRGNFEFTMNPEGLDVVNRLNNKTINYLTLNFNNEDNSSYIGEKRYLKYTGRFGMKREDVVEFNSIMEREAKKIDLLVKDKNEKILFLGTEEFMNIPLELSSKSKLNNVSFFATTRSPIIPIENNQYPINSKIEFKSSYNSDVINYIYNIDKDEYDRCFVFLETKIKDNNKSVIDAIFRNINCKEINVVTF